MANKIVRSGKSGVPAKKTAAKKALKKHAKKSAKPAVKHAAKKAAKKAVKGAAKKSVGLAKSGGDLGLVTAFHHMQRASVVISLMEKGTGEDLRDLLERGVKLYRKAATGQAGGNVVLRAIGLLRAAEHLSMAGLYEARRKHREKVDAPTSVVIREMIAETDRRLALVEHKERGKGTDLFPVTEELLRQAEYLSNDAHLAFELAMAADALCFALESGL
jgi:hypothetical protein